MIIHFVVLVTRIVENLLCIFKISFPSFNILQRIENVDRLLEILTFEVTFANCI